MSYKFILHGIALTLALLIKNVKVDVLNDSKETILIIYGSSILLVAITVSALTLLQFLEPIQILWSTLVFFIAMIHIGLTFIPKVCANISICSKYMYYE